LDEEARDHLHRLADALFSPFQEEFTELWNSHTVRGKTYDAKELVHPEVGPLSLTYQSFDVRGARGQQLVIYHAEPGSRSAQALALLGTISATQRQARPRRNH
jgi:hypothetical protein